ncbi:voltage-gated proton channel isoform X2 [Strongylocentrotus purpuratus]|uniref:Voltage-gated hydrogen channel 1 n=2 Tax=Strongylocentrotus purpuratus TaxID=7668 RepID=A0A7M7P6L3_STRPU|nr:voltage-gated proton channel isoform X2 [Strongylocentrotus purpuratus]
MAEGEGEGRCAVDSGTMKPDLKQTEEVSQGLLEQGDGGSSSHGNNKVGERSGDGQFAEQGGVCETSEDKNDGCETHSGAKTDKHKTKLEGETAPADAEMFGFRRLSDTTKPSEGNDQQRVIVKDDSSDSVVSDSHDGHPARTEPLSLREKLHEIMETQKFHIAILVLVVIDCILVIVELVIDFEVLSQEEGQCNATETDKEEKEVTAANVLHYISIGILSIFMIELLIKIPVFRMEFFRSKLEVFDGIIIVISFVLDVVSLIYEEQFAVLQLLVLLRLWRIVRVVNGVILSVETQAKKKIEQQKHLRAEVEHEMEKFRRYCAAQEKEIEVLRNTLNQHGIQIDDDYVAKKPQFSLNQLNVVVEMNSADKHDTGEDEGEGEEGGGDGNTRRHEKEREALGEHTITLTTDDNVNTIQADYHPQDTTFT